MQAIELSAFNGPKSLRLSEIERPRPAANEILLEVKAAGINWAEVEMTYGRYPAKSAPPFVMGFEAAGIVAERGANVKHVNVGDRVTAIVASGGYAEYATADANMAIPIPPNVSFAAAATIPINGVTAYAMLKLAAKPQAHESLLIQAAAGGVGVYLVQLAKIFGVKHVIALASSQEKLDFVKGLGADTVVDYSQANWPEQVRKATGGNGVDIVLEMASGAIGDESFRLLAPFGRIVVFGAKNMHDTIGPEKVQQLIHGNQSLIAFNLPSLRPEQIGACIPELLTLIADGKLQLFADNVYALDRVHDAFAALANRQTIGKVVLTP